MHFKSLLFVLSVVGVSAGGIEAGKSIDKDRYFLSLACGVAKPQYPDNVQSYWNPGFFINAGVHKNQNRFLAFSSGINFGFLPFDAETFKSHNIDYLEHKIKVPPTYLIGLDLNAYFFPFPSFKHPYLIAGTGFTSYISKDVTLYQPNPLYSIHIKGLDSQGLLLKAGLGIVVPVATYQFYAESTFNFTLGFEDRVVYLPIVAGVKF